MTEAHTTLTMQQAIENAHKERAAAFSALFSGWFGLRQFMPQFSLRSFGARHA